MKAAIQKRLFLALATPILALQLAAPASANDELYPDNPYHGRVSWDTPARPVTQPLPNHNWSEYPQGPNGPRVVRIELTRQELQTAQNRIVQNVRANAQAATRDLRIADNHITDMRRRLSWLEPYRNQSYEQHQAWVDLCYQLQELENFVVQARQYVSQCQAYEGQVQRLFSNPRATTVEITVLNHQRREYVPNHYLRVKAIERVVANPQGLGSTMRMTF